MGKGNFWGGTAGSHNRARLLRDAAAGGSVVRPSSLCPMLAVKLMLPNHDGEEAEAAVQMVERYCPRTPFRAAAEAVSWAKK